MATLNDVANNTVVSTRVVFDNTQIVDLTKLVCLRANTASATQYGTMKRSGTASGYQPTNGYRFVSVAIRAVVSGGTGTTGAFISTSTTDVGDSSAGAPTAFVGESFHAALPAAATTLISHVASFEPAKYISVNVAIGSNTTIYLYGYEEAI